MKTLPEILDYVESLTADALAAVKRVARTVALVVAVYARIVIEWLTSEFDGVKQAIEEAAAPESFGVLDVAGNTWFVHAHRVKIDRAGRLIFTEGIGMIVAVAEAGTWLRLRRGLTQEAFDAQRK